MKEQKEDIKKIPEPRLKNMLEDVEMQILRSYGNMEGTGIKKQNRKNMRKEKARILTELRRRE